MRNEACVGACAGNHHGRRFTTTSLVGGYNATIVTSRLAAMQFSASAACPAPRLLLLLYGQVRTFHYTQSNIAAMARNTSGDCYLAVTVADASICATYATVGLRGGCVKNHNAMVNDAPLHWSAFPDDAGEAGVDAMLRHASHAAFGGRLAYAIVSMPSAYSGWDRCARATYTCDS
jgi:hypothetical protein